MQKITSSLYKAELRLKSNSTLLVSYGENKIPVVIGREAFENTSSYLKSLIRMPYIDHTDAWRLKDIHKKSINNILKESLDHTLIKSNAMFTSWEMFNLLNHTDSCTLVFNNIKDFISTAHNICNLSTNYKFNNIIKVVGSLGYIREDFSKKDLAFCINFYKLEDFCPIFTKNVDGLGISIEILDKSNSVHEGKPSVIYGLYCVVSNYTDNIFYLDGVFKQNYSEKKLDIKNWVEKLYTILQKLEIIKVAKFKKKNSSDWPEYTSESIEKQIHNIVGVTSTNVRKLAKEAFMQIYDDEIMPMIINKGIKGQAATYIDNKVYDKKQQKEKIMTQYYTINSTNSSINLNNCDFGSCEDTYYEPSNLDFAMDMPTGKVHTQHSGGTYPEGHTKLKVHKVKLDFEKPDNTHELKAHKKIKNW